MRPLEPTLRRDELQGEDQLLDRLGAALADLEKYLELEPNAEDAEEVRENIEQLRPLVRSMN